MEGEQRETVSAFASTTGGVMTREAGAISGELELSTRIEAGRVLAKVRYAGADEWYSVEGSPKPLGGAAGSDPNEAHHLLLEHLGRPDPVKGGNEQPVSLEGFAQG